MKPDPIRSDAARASRALRLRARRDVSTSLTGAYRSAFRGQGLTFEELRDYAPGDDVRWLEWNATARMGRPIVKRMREERDVVVALLVDLSPSLEFGFAGATKLEAVRRAAAALAAAATAAQDRVALAVFADGLVQALPPRTGRAALERIFRALATPCTGSGTDAAPALDWSAERLPRNSLVVLISDFLFPDPGAVLRRCAIKHDLIALRIRDPADRPGRRLPPVRVRDAEVRRTRLWRSGRDPDALREAALPEATLRGIGADCGALESGTRLLPSLLRFVEERARRRN